MLYDSHAHLDLMSEEELKNALFSAEECRVKKIISCSTSFASNETNLVLSKEHPQILAAIGLYPLDAIELSPPEIEKTFCFFKEKIKKATAIGEVGLDFKYSTIKEDLEKQILIFSKFIELSIESKKPLIVHSRFAQKQVLELLREKKATLVLLHSFTDSQKLMKQSTDAGYFISCGMNVLQNPETQKNIKEFPLENLLLETDSPIRFNNVKATPCEIKSIAQKISELKEITLKEVEEQTEKNFKKLFGSLT